MDNKPLISILTLVYNHRDFIEQTIKSVVSQTYHNWEWIILDDGSTDGTGDIIKSIKDDRINYTIQEHTGVSLLTKTYNKALARCNGELIAMLDGDDYWPAYRLDMQVDRFNTTDIVLCYGECLEVNHEGKPIQYRYLPDDASIANNTPVGFSLKKFLVERKNFINTSTVMLRKHTLLAIGGFVEAQWLAEDFTTWTRLSLEGRFTAIPVCLGYWRRHSSSAFMQIYSEYWFDAGITFLRKFLHENEQTINNLGFSYNMANLESQWEDGRREFVHYLFYNRALELLRLKSFKEAQAEFSKFLARNPSLKTRFIYTLICFSRLLGIDIIDPLARWRQKMRNVFRA